MLNRHLKNRLFEARATTLWKYRDIGKLKVRLKVISFHENLILHLFPRFPPRQIRVELSSRKKSNQEQFLDFLPSLVCSGGEVHRSLVSNKPAWNKTGSLNSLAFNSKFAIYLQILKSNKCKNAMHKTHTLCGEGDAKSVPLCQVKPDPQGQEETAWSPEGGTQLCKLDRLQPVSCNNDP